MATTSDAEPRRGKDRERQVRTLFSEIAPRYDLLNRLLSLSVDRRWRRITVDRLLNVAPPGGKVLDACAGTLDLSLELAARPEFAGEVVAVDFAFPMLVLGEGKVGEARVSSICGDALKLPFGDHTFDAAMVGFGIRNLADLEGGARELWRVLKPGAPLAVLEFTTPPRTPIRQLYLFYFRRILPLLGGLVSGHQWAYSYLPESVEEFPEPPELAELLVDSGFDEVQWSYLTGGITALHQARKMDPSTARSFRPGPE